LGLFAAVSAFLLPVLFSPSVSARYWIPRYALMLVVAGVGVVYLMAKPAIEVRGATWAARTFLGVATCSALLSGNLDLAVAGRWNQGTGLLFLFGCVGAWSIGLRLTASERKLLGKALLAAVAVNVGAAILSMAFNLGSFALERLYGRAMGLLGNPVHLGPLGAAGLALLVPWIGRRWWRALLAVPIAAAIGLAGSPAGVGMILLPVLWALLRWGWRSGFALAVAGAAGILLVPYLDNPPQQSPQVVAGETSQADAVFIPVEGHALGSSLGGRAFGPRLETWRAGAGAWGERPLLGHGPGFYGEATVKHRSLEVVQAYPNALFTDAHNVVVELTVTTGALGVAALLAWLALASAGTSGSLALFALIVGLAHLYQPQFIGTALPALFALGAAKQAADTPALGRSLKPLAVAGGAAGAVMGIGVILGAHLLQEARLDFDLASANRAAGILAPWAEPLNRRALIHQFGFVTDQPEAARPAEEAFEEALEREPQDPEIWYLYGDVLLSHRKPEAARLAYATALDIDRYSVGALLGMMRLELFERDPEAGKIWLKRALIIDPALTRDYQLGSSQATEPRTSDAKAGPSKRPRSRTE